MALKDRLTDSELDELVVLISHRIDLERSGPKNRIDWLPDYLFLYRQDLHGATLLDGDTIRWKDSNKRMERSPNSAAVNPMARGRSLLSQAVANITYTTMALETELFDTDTIHDNVTNNSRLTCKTAGKYWIAGYAPIQFNATGGARIATLRLNGSTVIAQNQVPPATGATSPGTILTPVTLYQLSVNDYIEMQVFQDSGGSLNVDSPELMMAFAGA